MKIVIFTGAGISAESGLSTFRDGKGLWDNYRLEDVCSPEALIHNRTQVIEFYNMRRRAVLSAEPNAAHFALQKLEQYFDVQIITQNVDDLHERAGSKKVIHLHGEIRKLCSQNDVTKTVEITDWEQSMEAKHPDGSLLRPFIVFFGESVPMLETAITITGRADIFIIIGTSLQVYPAASLLNYVPRNVPIYLIDPNIPPTQFPNNSFHSVEATAVIGVPQVVEQIIANQHKNKNFK